MSTTEHKVAKVDDLKDGQMKTVEVNDSKILLGRLDGNFYAMAGTCTHYGAPLADGIMAGERVVCPWHHACFNLKNGDMLEPPARDSLPSFPVKVDGNDVIVLLPEDIPASRTPKMAKYNSENDDRTFVILGAGAAGSAAAETLRQDGFEGRILMITPEKDLPYDRPNLSKSYLEGEAPDEWIPLRSEDFYEEHDIEIKRGSAVTEVDTDGKQLKLENGDTLGFDAILLATGGKPRTLDVPGSDLDNVFTLRSFADSNAIIKAAKEGAKAVVVGASFIGIETAHSLQGRGVDVTVVGTEEVPFEKKFGREVGKMFQSAHEEKGTKFRLGTQVEKFEGDNRVSAVILKGGDKLEADLVVVGVGVDPATDYLKGVELAKDGSVRVNSDFKVKDGVYAAGDIARFTDWRTNEETRIEHWRTAEQQGRFAAHQMAGVKQTYDAVPFFWTTQVGLYFRFVGYVADWDDIIIDGDPSKKDFLAYYIHSNRVWAVAGNGRDREMAMIHELMRLNRMPSPETIRDGAFDPLKVAATD